MTETKKRKGTSPTQRTLARWRDLGYVCEVVEKWNPHVGIRQDLFEFIDILALGATETIGIQCTTTGLAERAQKAVESADFLAWMECPSRRFILEGWAKRGDRGKRKVWTPRTVELLARGDDVRARRLEDGVWVDMTDAETAALLGMGKEET